MGRVDLELFQRFEVLNSNHCSLFHVRVRARAVHLVPEVQLHPLEDRAYTYGRGVSLPLSTTRRTRERRASRVTMCAVELG